MTFRTPLPSAQARASMLNWLTAIGYRLNSAPFLSSVDVSRGSAIGNLGSLNPKMWNSRIRAIFTPLENECEVEFELTVSTLGQVFTRSDVEYWTYEVGETVAAICGKRPDAAEFVRRTRRAYWKNGWLAVFFTIIVLAVLIVSAIMTESLWVVIPLTVGVGAGCYFLIRAPRKIDVPPPKPLENRPDDLAPPIARY